MQVSSLQLQITYYSEREAQTKFCHMQALAIRYKNSYTASSVSAMKLNLYPFQRFLGTNDFLVGHFLLWKRAGLYSLDASSVPPYTRTHTQP